ncbi:MAG: hypothetical protein K2W95_15705 [Candidatus Obscuribacterales bacterium]|nr:hypothetical protein [Candidatus Obscuribacterales bacterium]
MADWADIQERIDGGRGKAGDVLGMPHDVYRIVAGSNGDFLAAGNKLSTQMNLYWKAVKEVKGSQEGDTKRGFSIYELVADMSGYKVGDLFLNADPIYQAGNVKVNFSSTDIVGICLASNAPEHKAIGVRCNKVAKVYRPSATGPSVDGYWTPTVENAAPLRLVSGSFGLGTVGQTPALVPMGIQPLSPSGEKAVDDVPGMARKSNFACYMPPLPGFTLAEGDRVEDNIGCIYSVIVSYRQDTGMAGNFLVLEKESNG